MLNQDQASDQKRTRLLIFVVAYNAATTIQSVLTRIPEQVFAEYDCEILIIDDQSTDATFEVATEHRLRNKHLNLTVLFNPENQGYGGNQKLGYRYAMDNGFDVVALLHGDGQYAPEMLPKLVAPVAAGEADAVFGSRMAEHGAARRGGMPLYKYVGNRILSMFQNAVTGLGLSEYHSGYRVYSVRALARLPFRFNTNDFHFDTEIIIQLWLARMHIREIPIPTYYGDEICRVNGIAYAMNVVRAMLLARLHGMQICYQRQYDIAGSDEERYPLKLGYPSSHTMAIDAVPSEARVLDIGCGNGRMGRELEKKGCVVSGIDGYVSTDQMLADFTCHDLNSGTLPAQAGDFDVILMLDVIEHLDTDAIFRLLDHLRNTCGPGWPRIIITTGNTAFGLIRLQLLRGAFNYGKRGILDMTHRHLFTFSSLRDVLVQSGFRIEEVRGVPAPFPAAIGDNALSRFMLVVNRFLIRLFPGVFSYQIFMRARPLATLEHLLESAHRASARRERNLVRK